MIAIRRLDEPDCLKKDKAQWTADYLAERAKDPKKKPSSKKYAHPKVRAALETMSHHKCFYCEQSTKQTKAEVDHYIEVAEKATGAFEWKNLYLACWDCNRKKQPNTSIPVTDCLDPCEPGVKPSDHLYFEDELIRFKSARGDNTIKKYLLDRPELDGVRVKQLQIFDKALDRVRQLQIEERRKAMTDGEKDLLRRFSQSDHPFSLMFSFYLEPLGL